MVHRGPFRFWTDISARDPHADIGSAHLGQLSLWLYSKGLRSWTIWSMVPDGPGPFLFRSDIGDDALAPISVGRGPSMALPWAIPILLPAARHVIGAVARMPISDSWPVVQSCFSTCPSMTGRHCPCLP